MKVNYKGIGDSSIKLTIGLVSLFSQIVIAFTSSQDIYLITGFPIIASFALDCYEYMRGKNISNNVINVIYIISFFCNMLFIALLFTYFILFFNTSSFASDNAFEIKLDDVNVFKECFALYLSISQIVLLFHRINFYIIDVVNILKKKKIRLITE